MDPFTGAIIGGGISGLGGILGGNSQEKAASAAAEAQQQAAMMGLLTELLMFAYQQRQIKPYQQASMSALPKQMFYAGVTPSENLYKRFQREGVKTYGAPAQSSSRGLRGGLQNLLGRLR